MSYFNLDDYETVAERITKFYTLYPYGRIITELVSDPANFDICRYKAYVFRHQNDKEPAATGYAVERRDPEEKIGKNGQIFYSVNAFCAEENCETSAIGRSLSSMGIGGPKRPTREEMGKVTRRPVPPATNSPTAPAAPDKPSDNGNGNGNGNKSTPVQTAPVTDSPAITTNQKVESLAKRMKEAENIAQLKQCSREFQFLSARLTQQQKIILRDAYFARQKQFEEVATAPVN